MKSGKDVASARGRPPQRAAMTGPTKPAPDAMSRRLGNQHLQVLLRARLLQAKLTVSHPQDVYEQEADRVADQVMRAADPAARVASLTTTRVQRACAECGDELMRSASHTESASTVDAATEHAIQSLSGRGSELPESVRAFMEPRFNADFSGVRVHTDARAHELARAVNAQAFTLGKNVVFGAGHYAPDTDGGKRLLAHELTHVVQQTMSAPSRASGTVQRQVHPETDDPWSKLSAAGQKRARALNDQCMALVGQLLRAQKAHVSVQRTEWVNYLGEYLLDKIGNLSRDSDIDDVAKELRDYSDSISELVEEFRADWAKVQRRYQDEHAWLLRQNSADASRAAKRIEDLYKEATRWLDRGAITLITDEDFGALKLTLEKGTHISTGILQASRERAREIGDMLDVVTELRIDGVDPEKYVPGWRTHVENELDNLERVAARARATPGTDYPAEFARLRGMLLEKRDATLKTKKRERPALGKAIDLVSGGVDAMVAPLVEAAKQAVDLAQIDLNLLTLGYYEPKFISDTAKAAEQGATTTDLLKGMVTGLLETPQRFIKAVEDGDWEAIGREAVNLYALGKAIKAAPHYYSRLPELVAKTQRGLRILRARKFGLKLNERRLSPQSPAPTGSQRTMAGTGAPPPGRPPQSTAPPVPHHSPRSPERLFEQLERGVDRRLPPATTQGQVAHPPPTGRFREGMAYADEAYAAYNEALAVSAGREVAVYYNYATGEYRVHIGTHTKVHGPFDDGDWGALVHYHPNPFNALGYRLPAPADFRGLYMRFFRNGKPVREFVESDIPGVGRGRTEYGLEGTTRKPVLYVRFHHPDGRPPTRRQFTGDGEYQRYWSERTVYVEKGSPEHVELLADLGAGRRQYRGSGTRTQSDGSSDFHHEEPTPVANPQRKGKVSKNDFDEEADTIVDHPDSAHQSGEIDGPNKVTEKAVPTEPKVIVDADLTEPLSSSIPPELRLNRERIGDYSIEGSRALDGNVLRRRILVMEHLGGKTTDTRPINRFLELLLADARAAGATRLQITGLAIKTPSVLHVRRAVERIGGTVDRIDARTIVIDIPVAGQ